MKFASFFRPDGAPAIGRVEDDRVIELRGKNDVTDLKQAIAAKALSALLDGESYLLREVRLAPVIPNPGKIVCVGLNYETHRKETGRAEAEHPAIFARWADTLVAHNDPIVRPQVSGDLDYEGELAIIIGKGGRAIPRAQAFKHIAGYSCFNDATLRDWQRHNIQFTPGKNFPNTGAFGPYLVTPEEIGDLSAQRVCTRLNGQIVQDQPIAEMIWPVDELIAYISTFTPLSPGDVIATGTPGGVGAKRTPPLWMKAGDTIEVDIGRVGLLRNSIADEA